MQPSLSTSWLGARLGRDPQALDAARREGRLLGIRADGGYTFPAWQFGRDGNVLPGLPRVISAARSAGLSDERLCSLLQARSGLGSGGSSPTRSGTETSSTCSASSTQRPRTSTPEGAIV